MNGATVFAHDGECKSYESITTAAVIGFTASNFNLAANQYRPMKAALITVETAAIRFTMDGTAPTTTAGGAVGHLVSAGQSFLVRGWENIRQFKCINEVGSSGAVVKASYFY